MSIYRKIIPTPMGDKLFYVYEYSYPQGFISDKGVDLSDVVFYVGKGKVKKKGVQRIDAHEHDAQSFPHGPYQSYTGYWAKYVVIQKIWKRGMEVTKRVVFETDDEVEAFLFEDEQIKKRLSAYLTNTKSTKRHYRYQ